MSVLNKLAGAPWKIARRVRRRIQRQFRDDEVRGRYQPYKVDTETWNSEYSSGRWAYLGQIEELGRYSVLAGYCHHFDHLRTILDVGCGEGLLRDALCPTAYDRYVGIDISSEAIHQAERKQADDDGSEVTQDKEIQFVAADAMAYEPTGTFDVVILNEVLYYLKDPLREIKRYAECLTDQGILVISMYHGYAPDLIWKMLVQEAAIDEVSIVHPSGVSWTVKAYARSSIHAI